MASGYRTLIVGAASLQGKDLATALRERRFPSRSLQLMESPAGSAAQAEPGGRLVDFADAAELQLTWDAAQLAEADVVFLCGESTGAARADVARAAAAGHALVIDLGGWTGDETAAPLLIGSEATDTAPRSGGWAVVAHPAAQALARLSTLAEQAGTLEALVGIVFEPASQRGLEAILELEKQSANLLALRSLPTDVYDAQVAFTVRAGLGAAASPSLAEVRERIAREYFRQMEQSAPERPPTPAALEVLHAPQFHGSALSLHLRYRTPPPSGAVEGAFAHPDVRRYSAAEGYPDAPAAAGEDAIQLGPLRADDRVAGAYWLFAVCDNLRRTAFSAVDGALALLRSRP